VAPAAGAVERLAEARGSQAILGVSVAEVLAACLRLLEAGGAGEGTGNGPTPVRAGPVGSPEARR
jgi:hypothetical protein